MRRSASFSASDTLWIGYLYRTDTSGARVRVRAIVRALSLYLYLYLRLYL